MKRIKIFIGSSIDELRLERAELMRFLGGLNNRYLDRGYYFEGYVCEETPASMQAEGSQAAHNAYIENDADAAIFLFFHKAGQYTLEELDLARRTFLSVRRPNVFVFFKSVENAPDVTEEIKECVRRVAEDYGHYFKMFDDVDTVKLELLQFLTEQMERRVKL